MGPVSALFVAVALLSAGLVGLSLLRNPVLRRISLRNMARRKSSTLLVIIGSMVGTALIAGSLIIRDTSDRLNQDLAYRYLGEIDEVVSLPGPQGDSTLYFDRQPISDRVTVGSLNAKTEATNKAALVDGAMAVVQEQVPLRKVDPITGEALLIEPRVALVALDWEELAGFGRRPPSPTRPALGEVIASEGLARELELAPGDTVEVLAGGSAHTFTVGQVEELQGYSGFWGIFAVFGRIPETLLMRLEDGQAVFAGGADHANAIFVSNAGGVVDSHQHTEAVQKSLAALLRDADLRGDFQVYPVKSTILSEEFSLGDMFLMFSMFVIVAGVLLVLNTYAMLAEERRTEMGVMRALGVRREHLVRLYLYEGLLYSLGAALLGVLVGLGLARLVVWAINELSLTSADETGLQMVFTAEPLSLVVAGAAGTVVTLGTVFYTSLRVSGVNIVAAMRDLPDPSGQIQRRWTVVFPLLLGLAGLLLSALGISSDNGILYVIGPTLAVLGLALALKRVLPARPLMSATCLGLVAYSQLAFVIPAVKEANNSGETTFLTGMILVLSAIGLVVLNFPIVIWLVTQTLGRLRRILPVVRIAIAYSAERPTQTGFSLGMFSLVIFFSTVGSIYVGLASAGVEGLQKGQVGGFDAILRVNPANPVSDLEPRLKRSAVVDFDGITAISALQTARAELPRHRQADYETWGEAYPTNPDASLSDEITGIDDKFIRTNESEFSLRAPEYGSDQEVWDAIAEDPSLVVLGDPYSGAHWRIRRPVVEPGDVLELRDPRSGQVYEKRVVARLVSSVVEGTDSLAGIIVSRETLEREFAAQIDAPTGPYLLRFRDDIDHKVVANSIEKELIDNGAQVNLVSELVEQSASWLNILRILQAFLALGLIVGIAGLAVVAARAVFQRKQEIGTLRALGFRKGMVLAYMLVESSFVTLLGVLLGVAVGTLAGYGVYVSYIKDDIGGPFGFPAVEVLGLAALVYVAGLVFTLLPALGAASTTPAEALRPKE